MSQDVAKSLEASIDDLVRKYGLLKSRKIVSEIFARYGTSVGSPKCRICKGVMEISFGSGDSTIFKCSSCGFEMLRYIGVARTIRHLGVKNKRKIRVRSHGLSGAPQRLFEFYLSEEYFPVELKSGDQLSMDFIRVREGLGRERFEVLYINHAVSVKANLIADVSSVEGLLKEIGVKKSSSLITVRDELNQELIRESELSENRKKYETIMVSNALDIVNNNIKIEVGLERIAEAYAKLNNIKIDRRTHKTYVQILYGKIETEQRAIEICRKVISSAKRTGRFNHLIE